MKKGLLLLALALGLVLLAIALVHRRPPEQIVIDGRTLKEWTLQAYARDPKAEAIVKDAGAKCLPGLLRLLHAHDSWGRAQALKLSPLLPRAARVEFFKRLQLSAAVRTREAAAHALGLVGDQSAQTVAALGRALRDSQGRVGQEAADALARIGTPALPVLTKALHDKAAPVRALGAFGLGEVGPSAVETLPLLSNLLDDADARVRATAAESLVLIGTETRMLTNGVSLPADPLGRKNALRLRLAMDHSLPAYITPLTTMAGSPEPQRRRRGIELLASLNLAADVAINTLTNALADPDPEVRLLACKGLARLGTRASSGVPLLTSNLSNPGLEVRRSSAEALGAIGPMAADSIPQLELLRLDTNVVVRSAATQALARIQPHRP